MGRLSGIDAEKYEELIKDAKQIELDMQALMDKPVVLGYARVSTLGQATDGNSLEEQEVALRDAGAVEIYSDTYTGATTTRPELQKLLAELRCGDTLVVTKLDRIARSVCEGSALIRELKEKGVKVHVLNMGVMDDSLIGNLLVNVLLSFAEFERGMIMERTRAGKEVAKQNPNFREGRPEKFTKEQIQHAVSLLQSNSYSQVVKLTGISKSTLIRANRKSKSAK